MELTSGVSLQGGKYRIISSLGQGGFGITYLAEHTTLGAHVCIKEFFIKDFCNRSDDGSVFSVVSENSRADIDGFKRKFLDEARKLYKIKHNHIVSVTDLFEENNTAYYVMDYIEGETLQGRINREGALSESDARRYICEVAEALRYIHENSMLHLDIKPGNIMVRSNGDTAIVIDFGLAKHYDPETGHQTTTYLGAQSPGYAPFEQGLSGGGVKMFCPATDIYSLGATLFALVTGVRPPEAATIPNEGLPELPAHLMPSTREAITCAMEYGIKSRPQSIDEFLSILDNTSDRVAGNREDTVVDTPYTNHVTPSVVKVDADDCNGNAQLKIKSAVDRHFEQATKLGIVLGTDKYSTLYTEISLSDRRIAQIVSNHKNLGQLTIYADTPEIVAAFTHIVVDNALTIRPNKMEVWGNNSDKIASLITRLVTECDSKISPNTITIKNSTTNSKPLKKELSLVILASLLVSAFYICKVLSIFPLPSLPDWAKMHVWIASPIYCGVFVMLFQRYKTAKEAITNHLTELSLLLVICITAIVLIEDLKENVAVSYPYGFANLLFVYFCLFFIFSSIKSYLLYRNNKEPGCFAPLYSFIPGFAVIISLYFDLYETVRHFSHYYYQFSYEWFLHSLILFLVTFILWAYLFTRAKYKCTKTTM